MNFCSAARKFNSPNVRGGGGGGGGGEGGRGGIIFQALIVTCPTEFAASSQPLTQTVAVCVNGCFCHESYQIVCQSETESNRPHRRCWWVWKEVHRCCVCVVHSSICCIACYFRSCLSDFRTVCCLTVGPGSKRCPARDRPLTWSKVLRSSLGEWVLSPFVCVVRCRLRLCNTSISPSGITAYLFFVRIYWIS